MKIEKRKVAVLKPYPYNPRRMFADQYEKLRKSIEEFGLVEPLVVNKKNEVLGGNQRLRVLQELGIKEVEVVVVDLSPSKERALNLALNRIQGSFNFEKLAEVFTVIDESDLELTGFSPTELELLNIPSDVNEIVAPSVEGNNDAEPVAKKYERYRVVFIFDDPQKGEQFLQEKFGIEQRFNRKSIITIPMYTK